MGSDHDFPGGGWVLTGRCDATNLSYKFSHLTFPSKHKIHKNQLHIEQLPRSEIFFSLYKQFITITSFCLLKFPFLFHICTIHNLDKYPFRKEHRHLTIDPDNVALKGTLSVKTAKWYMHIGVLRSTYTCMLRMEGRNINISSVKKKPFSCTSTCCALPRVTAFLGKIGLT